MEVVDTIWYASVTCDTVIWDVCFGEEVSDLSGRIDDWRANDTDRVRDIGAPDVRLQEGSVYLTCVYDCTSLSVEGADVVL